MIAIVGHPLLATTASGEPTVGGVAAQIALSAARAGASVEIIAKVGDDPGGDAAVLSLARAGVGHVATLRDPAHRTPVLTWTPDADAAELERVLLDDTDDEEAGSRAAGLARRAIELADPAKYPTLDPADVELALRYLPDTAVVILVEVSPEIVTVAAAEAAAVGAHLVVVIGGDRGGDVTDAAFPSIDEGALVLGAPEGEDAGTFAELVGQYAALVDGGTDPKRAFDAAVAARSAQRAEI